PARHEDDLLPEPHGRGNRWLEYRLPSSVSSPVPGTGVSAPSMSSRRNLPLAYRLMGSPGLLAKWPDFPPGASHSIPPARYPSRPIKIASDGLLKRRSVDEISRNGRRSVRTISDAHGPHFSPGPRSQLPSGLAGHPYRRECPRIRYPT